MDIYLTNKGAKKMDKQNNDKPINTQINDSNTEWKHNISLLKDPSFITK